MSSGISLWAVFLASTWLMPLPVAGGAISAFYSSGMTTPGVLMYNSTDNNIYSSLCTSTDPPIFPGWTNSTLTLLYPPLNGTSVAAVGYESSGGLHAVVHYQEQGGGIVQALFVCNYTTGFFTPISDSYTWIVSDGVLSSIENGTDLAVVNLGSTDGYRVYYRDQNSSTACLGYDQASGWFYDGFVSQDNYTGPWLAAAATSASNIMVVAGDLGFETNGGVINNLQYASIQSNDSWLIDAVPYQLCAGTYNDTTQLTNCTSTGFLNTTAWDAIQYDMSEVQTWTFPAFDANSSHFGLTFDSQAHANLFYISTDRALIHYAKSNGSWQQVTSPAGSKWPAADVGSADLSITYDQITNQVWGYYVNNGTLWQIHRSDNTTWENAVALPQTNTTTTTTTTNSSSGLSTGAKIGLGVGLGVGIPVVLAAFACCLFSRMKRSRQQKEAEQAAAMEQQQQSQLSNPAMIGSHPGSPAPAYASGYWANGQWVDGAGWQQNADNLSLAQQQNYYAKPAGEVWGPKPEHQQQQQQYIHEAPSHGVPIEMPSGEHHHHNPHAMTGTQLHTVPGAGATPTFSRASEMPTAEQAGTIEEAHPDFDGPPLPRSS